MLLPPRMFEVREKPEMVERALLVRFYFDMREAAESESLLEELGELVKTLGIDVVDSVLPRCREMHKKFLCGTGKAAEIVELARAHECDVIVIDNGADTGANRRPTEPTMQNQVNHTMIGRQCGRRNTAMPGTSCRARCASSGLRRGPGMTTSVNSRSTCTPRCRRSAPRRRS